MAERISIGIDVGTSGVKVLVAESNEENRIKPKILGAGYSESRGLRHGYITDLPEAIKSVKHAVSAAEKSSGYKISKAYLSVGGMGLGSAVYGSSMSLGGKDSEIGDSDIKKLLEIAREKGVVFAIKVAKSMNDPFLLDTLHDALAKEGYYKDFVKK